MTSYEWKRKNWRFFHCVNSEYIASKLNYEVCVTFFLFCCVIHIFTDFRKSIWRLFRYKMLTVNMTVAYEKKNVIKNGKCSGWITFFQAVIIGLNAFLKGIDWCINSTNSLTNKYKSDVCEWLVPVYTPMHYFQKTFNPYISLELEIGNIFSHTRYLYYTFIV